MTKRQRVGCETKINKMGTKILPLPGDLNARMVRCGKANCKCVRGELHGPYYVRRWRSDGQRLSAYVKKRDVSAVTAAVETYRQEHRQSRRNLQGAMRTLRSFRSRLLDFLSEMGQ